MVKVLELQSGGTEFNPCLTASGYITAVVPHSSSWPLFLIAYWLASSKVRLLTLLSLYYITFVSGHIYRSQ